MLPNCYRCDHYYVTWDKDYPHGCRAMAFKSRFFPGRMVSQSTPHEECLSFKEKTAAGSAPPLSKLTLRGR